MHDQSLHTLSVNIKFNSVSQPALYVALIASVIHLVLSEGATRWSLIQDLAASTLTVTGCFEIEFTNLNTNQSKHSQRLLLSQIHINKFTVIINYCV